MRFRFTALISLSLSAFLVSPFALAADPPTLELELGQTATGEIAFPGEEDHIRFPAVQGTGITAVAKILKGSTLSPGLKMIDPSGVEVPVGAFVKVSKKSASLKKFVTNASGVWTLVILGTGDSIGGYSLKTKGKPPKKLPKIVGRIASEGEVHQVKFGALAGTQLTATLAGDKKTKFEARLLRLLDPDGKEVPIDAAKVTKGVKDSLKKFPLPRFGEYTLEIGALDAATGPYKLSVKMKSPKPVKLTHDFGGGSGGPDGVALESLRIWATDLAPAPGDARSLVGVGLFADGRERDLTRAALFTSSHSGIAAVSNVDGSRGVLTAAAAGGSVLRLAYQGVESPGLLLLVGGETVALVTVLPDGAHVAKGEKAGFTARADLAGGGSVDATHVAAWKSDATSRAAVDDEGMVTGVGEGGANLVATVSGVASTPVAVTVDPRRLLAIRLSPRASTIGVGAARQLGATGIYSDATTSDISAAADWESDFEASATVSGVGLVQGVALGAAGIRARLDGVVSGPAIVLVGNVTVDSVTISPGSASVAEGATTAFTARAVLSDGSSRDVTAASSWSAGSPATAIARTTFDEGGIVAGVLTGDTTVIAGFLGQVSAAASLSVSGAEVVAVRVTPTDPGLAPGEKITFSAHATLSDGSVEDVTGTAAWGSSNGAAGSLTGSVLTAGASGATGVKATVGGVSSPVIVVRAGGTLLTGVAVGSPSEGPLGGDAALSANASFDAGPVVDVTGRSRWSSADPAALPVTDGVGGGMVVPRSETATSIFAAYGGFATPPYPFTGTAAAGVSLDIYPDSPHAPLGLTKALAAQLGLTDGRVRDVASSATWNSSVPARATVSASGVVSTLSRGTTVVRVSVAGVSDGTDTFTVDPPIAVSVAVTPDSPIVAEGDTLQLTGTRTWSDATADDVSSTATWNSTSPGVGTVSATGLFSANQKGTTNVTAAKDGITSPPVSVEVEKRPVVTDLDGTTIVSPGGSSTGLKINGANFLAASTVSFGDSEITVTVKSITSTRITVDVTVGAAAAIGARAVTVSLPGAKAHISGSLAGAFYVKGTAPILTNVTPTTADRGRTTTLTVTGDNFDTVTPGKMSAALKRGGIAVSDISIDKLTVTSTTKIDLEITVDAGATFGDVDMTISHTVNGVSNVLGGAFAVTELAPTVSSIDPKIGARGEAGISVTIDGTNFVDGDAVSMSGSGVTASSVSFVSSTRLTATVKIDAGAAKGARGVTVTHSVAAGGKSGTLGGAFTVTDPAPVITTVSPENVDLGTTKTVSLTGTNLNNGTFSISPSTDLTISSPSFSGTTASFSLTVGGGAVVGLRDVTLLRTDGQSVTKTKGIKIGPPGPTIATIKPSKVLPGMTRVLFTVAGTRFESGKTSVKFSGSDLTVDASSLTVSGATSLSFEADVKSDAAIGGVDFTVTVTGKGDGVKEDGVTVIPGDPRVTSFSAKVLAQSSTGISVTVTGTNFRAKDTLSASGSGVSFSSVTVVSTVKITATAAVTSGAATGLRDFTVAHASSEGGRSSTLSDAFEVVGKTPTVTSVTPPKLGRTGSGGATRKFPITITGTNFATGATLSITESGGSGVSISGTPVVAGKTAITAVVQVTSTATKAKWDVKVTNPGSLGNSGTGGNDKLEIVGETTLNVNSVTPNLGNSHGGQRVTIYGSGFDGNDFGGKKGTAVDFGTVRASGVQVIDQNTLLATVPAPKSLSSTKTTEVDVKVTNDPGGSPSSATLAKGYAYKSDNVVFGVSSSFPTQGSTGVVKSLKACVFLLSEPGDTSTITTSSTNWFEAGAFSVTGLSVGFGPEKRMVVLKTTLGSLPKNNAGEYVMQINTTAKDLSGSVLIPTRLSSTGTRDQYSWTIGTGTDTTAPTVTITPTGSSEVTTTTVKCVFGEEVDPSTLVTANVTLETGTTSGSGTKVGVRLSLADDLKTLTLTPETELKHGQDYVVTVTASVKDLSGNAIVKKTQTFKTGSATDTTAPTIDSVRIEKLPSDMDGSGKYKSGASTSADYDVYLPRYGWKIVVTFTDLGGAGIDETSLTVTSSVKVGSTSAGSDLSSNFEVSSTRAEWRIPSSTKVTAGSDVDFKFKIKDKAGTPNQSAEKKITVDVVDRDTIASNSGDLDPIDSRETWVLRFDRDKYKVTIGYVAPNVTLSTSGSSDKKIDFRQSLEIIGFQSDMSATGAKTATNGNEVGTNAILERMFREAIRGRTRERFFIGNDGTRGSGAVDIELLLPGEQGSLSSLPSLSTAAASNSTKGFSEMDIGGDIHPAPGVGDTAIGRAFYDTRNRKDEANINNAAVSGNSGIFVINTIRFLVNGASGTLFRILYDPFITGRGGTPVGKGANDATVLAGTFDRTSGSNTTAQNDRYDAIMDGIDGMAFALSATIAHEIGHSLGLVPDGAPPKGLFGKAHESNTFTEATGAAPNTSHHLDHVSNDVMSASSSFRERNQTGTDFQSFSPYDRNYLRNRQVYDETK